MSLPVNLNADSRSSALALPPCVPALVASSLAGNSLAGNAAAGNSVAGGQAVGGFVDRRESGGESGRSERRQFGSTHSDLSPDAFELATAIDRYKVEHRRRYITCEEMLAVVKQLGYYRDAPTTS